MTTPGPQLMSPACPQARRAHSPPPRSGPGHLEREALPQRVETDSDNDELSPTAERAVRRLRTSSPAVGMVTAASPGTVRYRLVTELAPQAVPELGIRRRARALSAAFFGPRARMRAVAAWRSSARRGSCE